MKQLAWVWLAGCVLLAGATGCADSPSVPTPTPTPGPTPTPVPMRIDSVTPAVGSTTTPTSVVIAGVGFDPGARVSVGDVPLQPSSVTATSISVTVPPRPQGVYSVVVTNPDGRTTARENAFRFELDPPVNPNGVRITGQLLAGGSGLPFGGASMRLLSDIDPTRPAAISDADGRFTIVGIVPPETQQLQIRVHRDGLLWQSRAPWTLALPRTETENVVLRVPDLLLVRVGESFRGLLASGPQQDSCTFESIPCLALVVDGPPNALIELELIPESGQLLGLIRGEEFLAPTVFPTRMTVPPTSVWIMGGFGSFTVKATEVKVKAISAARRQP